MKLLVVITNAINIKNRNLIHIKIQMLERLNELFIKEEITKYQYQTHKEEIIYNSARIQVKNVLKIMINDNENGIIKLMETKIFKIKF